MQTRSVSPVFVGRQTEIARLVQALDRAAAGSPQAVLVGGEAGIGKTRLLQEFHRRAERPDTVIAVGACLDIGAGGPPFAPVAQLLRALSRQLGTEVSDAAEGFRTELAWFLPELGDPGASAAQHPDSPGRLFELLTQLLQNLARQRTLVLTVEDLHWADRSTRELLGYLCRALTHSRVLLIASYRTDDLHRRHPLRPFLAELDRTRTASRVELAPFTHEEVAAQLAGIRGQQPLPEIARQIHARTDGNAFFVEEISCSTSLGCAAPLSDSLRDLLLVRVEALSEPAQALLRVLSAGGYPVEYDLLAEVAGLREDIFMEVLRQAVGANVVQAEDGHTYRFRHALMREVVDEDLLPGERARLHRAYAEALVERPGLVAAEVRQARLAHHWYHARDTARALPALLAAADRAAAQQAPAEQLQLLNRVLELWDEAPEDARSALRPGRAVEAYPLCDCCDTQLTYLDILAELTVAQGSGDPERGLSVANRALRLLNADEHPARAAWFWIQKSRLIRRVMRGDGAEELRRARVLLAALPPSPLHAWALSEAASWSAFFAPGAEGLHTAERAVQLSEEHSDPGCLMDALISRGGLRVAEGQEAAGLGDFATVRAEVLRTGDWRLLSRSHANHSAALEVAGRSAEAVEVAAEGAELAARHGLRDARTWIVNNLTESLLSLGRWTQAADAAHQTRQSALSPLARILAAERFAQLALARGDEDTAAAELAVLDREHGGAHPVPVHRLTHRAIQLGLAALRGRILDAREFLVPAEHGDGRLPRYSWPLLLRLATAESDARDIPAAGPDRDASLHRIREVAAAVACPYPVWRAHRDTVAAELRRAEKRDTPDDWALLADAWADLARPAQLALVELRWAESLLAAGDRTGAGRTLRRALRGAEPLGAQPLTTEITRLARRARLPLRRAEPPAGRPGPASALTDREQAVLERVALGRSNRQIAEELFISPKTVSVHVSNVLAKLEVSSRGEAAALAHRLGLLPSTS